MNLEGEIEMVRLALCIVVFNILILGNTSEGSGEKNLFEYVALPSDKHRRCDQYANSAVAQHIQNTELGCGITGTEWSSDYNYHFALCMHGAGSDSQKLIQALENRNRQLLEEKSQCQAFKNRFTSECDDYSLEAVNQQVFNLFYGCGGAGRRWHSHFYTHLEWCTADHNLNLRRQIADDERYFRKKFLKKCSACWRYAGMAVIQNRLNEDYSCEFSGWEWNSSIEEHAEWCFNNPPNNYSYLEYITNWRFQELVECFPGKELK